MSSKGKYNKETLNLMGVHDLRKMARDMGIESPTTKKKNELVDAIHKKGIELVKAEGKAGKKPSISEEERMNLSQNEPYDLGDVLKDYDDEEIEKMEQKLKGRPPKPTPINLVFEDSERERYQVEDSDAKTPEELMEHAESVINAEVDAIEVSFILSGKTWTTYDENGQIVPWTKQRLKSVRMNGMKRALGLGESYLTKSELAELAAKQKQEELKKKLLEEKIEEKAEDISTAVVETVEVKEETKPVEVEKKYAEEITTERKYYKRPDSRYENNDGRDSYKKKFYRDDYKERNSYDRDAKDQDYSENVAQDTNQPIIVRDEEEIPLELKEGILEIMPDGYGFLRAQNYESGCNDAYVSPQKIKKFMLRKGDKVKAEARKLSENKPASVVNVLTINGVPLERVGKRVNFDTLTPIYPNERYRLEIDGEKNDCAIRSIDLVAPIGKGQRAMIVSPPKAGKTTLLKKIAHSISENYPDAYLMVLLIDERPEEVTDMQRSTYGEVIYSTFDEMPEHHTKAAELVLERAKRLVEMGRDVIILMDSLTRLARAYNLTISPTGRTLSGGIDPGALHSPKRFFGAARNIENGGSLTIIATALVDTGSRMDDVIYEEFKGTGNMEIHLDRRLSEKRIFPAIDLYRSGTRREELLLDGDELQGIWAIRKLLSSGGEGADATENLIGMMVKTKTNAEFIKQVNLQVISMQKQGYMV